MIPLRFAFACSLALTGCDVSGFDNYRIDAPVLVLDAPSNYPAGTFGAPLAVTTDETMDQDWVISGGGLGLPVVALPLRAGNALHPDLDPWYVCGANAPCGDSDRVPSGIGVAAVSSWRGATLCGLTGVYATTAHTVQVRCHTPGANGAAFTIAPPPGFEQSAFGVTLASPRRRRASDPAPGEIVFIQAGAEPGYVFAARPGALDNVTPMDLAPHAAFGEAMSVGYARRAGAPVDLVLAVGAPGMRAAYVFQGDPRAGRAMQRFGCVLRGGDPGFGGAVATGDVDGDGSDDLIVGSRAGEPGRLARVHVFLERDVPTDHACSETAWPEAMVLDCSNVANSGVVCESGNEDFGGTLAAGDTNGDGRDEVLVGARRADALDVHDAGAVWVYSPNTSGLLVPVSVLRASSPLEDAHLGLSLVVAKVGAREEVLIGEPGQRNVRAYFCSGASGDRPDAGGLNGQCR